MLLHKFFFTDNLPIHFQYTNISRNVLLKFNLYSQPCMHSLLLLCLKICQPQHKNNFYSCTTLTQLLNHLFCTYIHKCCLCMCQIQNFFYSKVSTGIVWTWKLWYNQILKETYGLLPYNLVGKNKLFQMHIDTDIFIWKPFYIAYAFK